MNKAARGILEGLQQAVAYMDGELPKGSYRAYARPDVDVKAIRKQLGMSQQAFAARFGFSLNTLRHWEQNNRKPNGSARAYLSIIGSNPDAVEKFLRLKRVR